PDDVALKATRAGAFQDIDVQIELSGGRFLSRDGHRVEAVVHLLPDPRRADRDMAVVFGMNGGEKTAEAAGRSLRSMPWPDFAAVDDLAIEPVDRQHDSGGVGLLLDDVEDGRRAFVDQARCVVLNDDGPARFTHHTLPWRRGPPSPSAADRKQD